MPQPTPRTPFAALLIAFIICSLPAAQAQPSQTLLVDIDHRPATSLNGEWKTILDPYATGLYNFHQEIRKDGFFENKPFDPYGIPQDYDFAAAPSLRVPGDWNTQRPELLFYEGLTWYQRYFEHAAQPGTRSFLHIGAANYRSFVWVNAKKVCEHEGGFTPFDCDVTSALSKDGKNFVVIAVDDTRIADGVPTLQTDWWNYGGLTRDVSVVDVPDTFIDDYDLHLSRADHGLIEGYVHVAGAAAGTKVTVMIPELHARMDAAVDSESRAAIKFPVKGLKLWEPGDAKLYRVELTAGTDKLIDEMGFRTIETRGTEILLNGKPIFLKGISVHAEAPYRTGRAYTQQDMDTLLGWAKELGCNYVRLAHYPHDERMLRTADRMGILVWSEIPDYWALQFDNPAVLAKSKQQLGEMIRRDRDKASIILWSVANETPINDARNRYLTTMADLAHQLDPTRLVTAALLVRTEKTADGTVKILDDPLAKALDVMGVNEYIGWYEQKPEGADTTHWDIHFDKPLMMSEWGADAKAGRHTAEGAAAAHWTEEYQALVYQHQIAMLNRIPQLRGTSPWILMDFRSPRRTVTGIQDYFNRKGVVSDQGEKKQAFFVLQKAYHDPALFKPE